MTMFNTKHGARGIFALMLAVSVSGCGTQFFTEPTTNPAIEENFGNGYSALVTTADRRIVIASDSEHTGVPQMVCAEPSPDAITAVAASFGAQADGSIKDAGGNEQSLKAAFARGVATSTGALTRRSQGVQFFRDGVFALCQGAMNGIASPPKDLYDQMSKDERLVAAQIGRETIVTMFSNLVRSAETMVLEEVKQDEWHKSYALQNLVDAPENPKVPDGEGGSGN